MNMPDFLQGLVDWITGSLDSVLGAVLVFIVGWLLALLVRKVVHGLMKRTEWDELNRK